MCTGQTETLDYFAIPLLMFDNNDNPPESYFLNMFIEDISLLSTPLTYASELRYIEECQGFFSEVNFFNFYFLVIEKYRFNKKIQVILKCEHRKDILINACVETIVSLVSKSAISDSYTKSFLALCGKKESMFTLYKSKRYKQFVVDSFLERPILGPCMMSEYNCASGNLLSYFTMERDSRKISQVFTFVGCTSSSNNVEKLTSNLHWLRLKEQVTMLKPLQFLGIVKTNPTAEIEFLQIMNHPDKKKILVEINIDPLVDQLDKGSISHTYVLSFLHAFCVSFAYEIFEKNQWDEFLCKVVR